MAKGLLRRAFFWPVTVDAARFVSASAYPSRVVLFPSDLRWSIWRLTSTSRTHATFPISVISAMRKSGWFWSVSPSAGVSFIRCLKGSVNSQPTNCVRRQSSSSVVQKTRSCWVPTCSRFITESPVNGGTDV